MPTRHTPKTKVVAAIKAINSHYGEEVAQLIDWSADRDGYAIWTEFGVDAITIAYNEAVRAAVPAGYFLEPINSGSMRLWAI